MTSNLLTLGGIEGRFVFMEWRDQGILLSAKKHGETSAIIEVFTPLHGRHLGVVRAGASRKLAPVLQPGAQLEVTWRARLQDHIGTFTVEPLRSRSATAISNRLALAGLNAVLASLRLVLPEREVLEKFYVTTEQLLDLLDRQDIWSLAYLKWEMQLLETLGYGLDLKTCAVTNKTNDLKYISPKTGRAVSPQGAGEWADRLLPLPDVMLGNGNATQSEIISALRVTGFFIENHLCKDLGLENPPAARGRLLELFEKL